MSPYDFINTLAAITKDISTASCSRSAHVLEGIPGVAFMPDRPVT